MFASALPPNIENRIGDSRDDEEPSIGQYDPIGIRMHTYTHTHTHMDTHAHTQAHTDTHGYLESVIITDMFPSFVFVGYSTVANGRLPSLPTGRLLIITSPSLMLSTPGGDPSKESTVRLKVVPPNDHRFDMVGYLSKPIAKHSNM